MPLLPYHKYLGPGNELDNGEPVDEDDRIAQSHDSAYASALTAEDISKADEEAVKDFWNDFSTTGNWHSLVGAAGLSVKQQVEKRTGVLYPDMSRRLGKYRSLSVVKGDQKAEFVADQRDRRFQQQQVQRDRMQDPEQPSTSRDVSDIGQQENNQPMNTDEVDAPQQDSGGVAPMGGVTNPHNDISTLYMNKSLGMLGNSFFKKSRLMHTWGFASKKFSWGNDKRANDFFLYTTSLAYVPVDWVPFYLSPMEFEILPPGSYIKEVYVEIIPKGVRCSFDVGTSITGSANSMHVIFGKHCVGLNTKLDMINRGLKQNEKSPMTIESVYDVQPEEFTNRFYGNVNEYHGGYDVAYPVSWGSNRALPYYACVVATGNESKSNYYHIETGWPRMDNVIDRYNLNEHINSPCIKYSYKPRNGILKNLKHSAVVPNKVLPIQGRVGIGSTMEQYVQEGTYASKDLKMRPFKEQIFNYTNIVEKCHLTGYYNNTCGTLAQPQVHIGIEPVQSNSPSDSSPSFVNASAEYEIKCTCIIGCTSEFMYEKDTFDSKSNLFSGMKDNNHHYFIAQNHVGGAYCYNWNGTYNTNA